MKPMLLPSCLQVNSSPPLYSLSGYKKPLFSSSSSSFLFCFFFYFRLLANRDFNLSLRSSYPLGCLSKHKFYECFAKVRWCLGSLRRGWQSRSRPCWSQSYPDATQREGFIISLTQRIWCLREWFLEEPYKSSPL